MPDERQEFRALMERVQAGSEDAVRELLDQYGDYIIRVIRRRLHRSLRSRFDSQDFAQAVWTSFFGDRLPSQAFDRPEALIQHLRGMASHKVIDAARQVFVCENHKVAREHSLDGSAAAEAVRLQDAGPSPSQAAIANERWEMLRRRMPRSGRRILTMLREGLTYEEIAQRLGVTAKTIQRLLRNLAARDFS